MRRGALGASGKRLLQENQAQVLSVRRTGGCRLDLHGTAGIAAALAGIRMDEGRAFAPLRQQAHPGVQLPPGHGGRDRLRPRVVSASSRSAQRCAPCQRWRRAHARDRGAVRGGRDERRDDHRRAPPGAGGPPLLAHHAVDHAVPHHDPPLRRQCAQRPCLGADRRRELHGLVLYLSSRARSASASSM